MKKFVIFCLCFSLIFLILPSFTSASEVTISDTTMYSFGIDANNTMLGAKKLNENIRAGFLYEANSQTLMYAWEADKPMYPASLVKILTAFIAIQQGKLTDVVTVSDEAVSSVPFDAVSAKLQVGEQISLEDLLYCLMVGSANDAAAVIAEHISGSQDAFVQEMNAFAKALGCNGSTFTNPHGLHDEAQVTTARDVVRILDHALRNDAFYKLFTTTKHTVEATNMSEARNLVTGNSMMDKTSRLYYDARAIGGRTGVTEDGRRCLAAAAKSNGMLLISVVMGSESVYQEDGYSAISVGGYKETTTLFDAGFNGYVTTQILYANQALRQHKVTNGDCDLVIGPISSVSAVLPENVTADKLTYRYTTENFTAPITKGEKVSAIQIWNGNMCVGQTDLYALNSVASAADKDMFHDVQQEGNDRSSVVIIGLVVLAGVLCLYLIFKFQKKIRRFFAKKRSAQYRRNRRRSR